MPRWSCRARRCSPLLSRQAPTLAVVTLVRSALALRPSFSRNRAITVSRPHSAATISRGRRHREREIRVAGGVLAMIQRSQVLLPDSPAGRGFATYAWRDGQSNLACGAASGRRPSVVLATVQRAPRGRCPRRRANQERAGTIPPRKPADVWKPYLTRQGCMQ